MPKIITINRKTINQFELFLNIPESINTTSISNKYILTKQEIEILIREALNSLNPVGFEIPNMKELKNG